MTCGQLPRAGTFSPGRQNDVLSGNFLAHSVRAWSAFEQSSLPFGEIFNTLSNSGGHLGRQSLEVSLRHISEPVTSSEHAL